MKHLALAIAAALLTTAVYAETSPTAKEIAWIDAGKNAVRQKLKDPDSATFKDVFFQRGSRNIPVTCGSVNAKNSFGGYTGFTRFVSAGSADLTFLESEVKGFDDVWGQFCK